MQNMQDYKLAVKELHKQYGNHKVIKGISLRAKAGDVISIIGSSGSSRHLLALSELSGEAERGLHLHQWQRDPHGAGSG